VEFAKPLLRRRLGELKVIKLVRPLFKGALLN